MICMPSMLGADWIRFFGSRDELAHSSVLAASGSSTGAGDGGGLFICLSKAAPGGQR